MSTFEQAVEAATARVEAMATQLEMRFARSMRRLLLVGGVALCLLLISGGVVDWWRGCHLADADCRAVQFRQADGRP